MSDDERPSFTIYLEGDGSYDDGERIANTAFMAALKESGGTGWVVTHMTGAIPE